MTGLDEMARLLQQATDHLHQAVEVGARTRSQGPEARRAVDQQWENFMVDFLGYLKKVGREHNENLLAGVSFTRILARVR